MKKVSSPKIENLKHHLLLQMPNKNVAKFYYTLNQMSAQENENVECMASLSRENNDEKMKKRLQACSAYFCRTNER